MNELRIAKERLLRMCSKLSEGHVLYKQQEAEEYGCSLRSIQRDIDDLRLFFSDRSLITGTNQELVYDKRLNGYRLEPPMRTMLTDEETFAVIKILLESRSLTKEELTPILDKLVSCCVPDDHRKQIASLISNESFHYIEPHHKKKVLHTMWQLSGAVREQRVIKITYIRKDNKKVRRQLRPVGILFSEFYFYLVAFIDPGTDKKLEEELGDGNFPTIYRIDRIQKFAITEEHFSVPYRDRFEEGEFRKRVQFMQTGKLRKVSFYVKDIALEAVLDRIPTAEVVKHDRQGYLVRAEAYGQGIDMWLNGQGENIKLL